MNTVRLHSRYIPYYLLIRSGVISYDWLDFDQVVSAILHEFVL